MRQPLLDFDGPIVPSEQLVYDICRMVDPELTWEEMLTFFHGNVHHDEGVKRRLKGEYCLETYKSKVLEVPFVPGADRLLQDLAAHDQKIIFITSSQTDAVERYLRHYNLPFDEVWGADKGTRKTEKMEQVMKRHGIKPEKAVYVTDTLGDVFEARHAGLESIAVTWGMHRPQEFVLGSPAHMVHNMEELHHHLIGKYRPSTSGALPPRQPRRHGHTPHLQRS